MIDMDKQPRNLNAEKSVLGAMMMTPDAVMTALERLQPEDFFYPSNQTLFKTIAALDAESAKIDFVSLTDRLEKNGTLEQIGGITYCSEICTFLPSAAHVDQYIDIVLRDSISRNIIKAAQTVDERIIQGDDPNDVGADVVKAIEDALSRKQNEQTEYTVAEMVNRAMDRAEYAMEHPKEERKELLLTGWPEHDRYCGFRRGNNVIIAARPGLGKSAYALGLALRLAGNGKSGLMFSKEMKENEIGDRMVSHISGVPLHNIRNADLTSEDFSQMWQSFNGIDRHDLITVDDPAMTMRQIYNRCKRQKARHGLDFVVIDYLQIVTPGREYAGENRQCEVANMSRAIKLMAMELGITTFTICQLNRDADKRKNNKPILADLRESGSIENDADIVMMLYRESYYNEKARDDNSAELLLRKNRNDTDWTIPLIWNPQTVTYREKVIKHNDPPRWVTR
jgi:replicative DNA helicase